MLWWSILFSISFMWPMWLKVCLGGTISMRPATTFDRGVSLIRHQNEDMNTSDPNAVEAALAVPASDGIVWRNSRYFEQPMIHISSDLLCLWGHTSEDPSPSGSAWRWIWCGSRNWLVRPGFLSTARSQAGDAKSICFTYAFYVCRVVRVKSFRIGQSGNPMNHISGVLFIYGFLMLMKPWRVIYILNGLAFFT